MPNFFLHTQYAKRRGIGSGGISNTELGSGHRIYQERLAIAKNDHLLICNADHHPVTIIRDASGEEDGDKKYASAQMSSRKKWHRHEME